jgi:cation:H+ antiporter
MVWLQFIVSSAILVIAAHKLAQYSDIIAVRTRLGGMFIGTLLLAGATSLPELLSAINALWQGVPNMAAGSIFGSSMFNMFMLAVLDMLYRQTRILRRVAMNHALSGSLAMLLTGMAVFFILADVDSGIGWIGWDSLLLIGVYLGGVRLLQHNGFAPPADAEIAELNIPSLPKALVGFSAATLVMILVVPWLVSSAAGIADITGLSAGFIGATLLAIITSLPELVTTIAAVRMGAYDLAVGNLFGSNIFNMFVLGLTDAVYLPGHFIELIDPAFALIALLGLLLTGLGLIGNLARVERRLFLVEVDALLILVCYFLGMWFLYSRGLGI